MTAAERMKLPELAFTVIDWSAVPPSMQGGDPGEAVSRTFEHGDLRVRIVEYSPGYVADHWCDRGHVLYALEGELEVELRDGRAFTLRPGMSFVVSDYGDAAHRVVTRDGAKAFIVD